MPTFSATAPEINHAPAASWKKIIHTFPKAKRLGLTATPGRLDRKPLTPAFTKIVSGPSHKELRAGGWLAEFSYFAPEGESLLAELTKVKVRLGDYDKTQLGSLMSRSTIVGDAVHHFKQLAGERTAIAFCVTIEASKLLVERFNAAGIPALHVDASTPDDERSSSVEALRDGRIRVLSNVEIMTEGVDVVSSDAVILMRPTHSKTLFLQMTGRALRPNSNVVLILDHAANVYEHGFPDDDFEWTVEGYEPKRAGKRAPLRKCPECSCVDEVADTCPSCGHEHVKEGRSVEEVDGTLILVKETGYCRGYAASRKGC